MSYASATLKILAVSVDDPGTDSTIRAFVKQYGLSFEVLHDPRGNISELYDISGFLVWSSSNLPPATTFLELTNVVKWPKVW